MRSHFCGLLVCLVASSFSKPLKVFILAGQSNMQGHANISTIPWVAEPLLHEMVGADGKPVVCDKVWISSMGCGGNQYSDLIEKTGKLTAGYGASDQEIGPEFTFGLTMEKALKEPILIIKASWGGRSLMTDFRPPSAGPRLFSKELLARWKRQGKDPEWESAKEQAQGGVFYWQMIDYIQSVLANIRRVMPGYDPKQGYQLAGFVWFQGFNDMVDDGAYPDRMKPGGYADYTSLLTHLVQDVRHDLSTPQLPFVIGEMGVGGNREGAKPPQLNFRLAEHLPSMPGVVTVETSTFWDDSLEDLQQKQERKLTLTPEEVGRLKAVSNGGYHYMGAAKILAPIGEAFAEALLRMR